MMRIRGRRGVRGVHRGLLIACTNARTMTRTMSRTMAHTGACTMARMIARTTAGVTAGVITGVITGVIAGPIVGASAPHADHVPLPDDVRAIWVVRDALGDPGPERIVRDAIEVGANTLFVQIVGRGDAWFTSSHLPRAEMLPPEAGDPLAEILSIAHRAGLSVHAWINVAVLWSGAEPPASPMHVVNARPEWVMCLPSGYSMVTVPQDTLRALYVEGLFAELAHEGYRAHLARVVDEVLDGYDVDGIHLDYVRRPVVDGGYDRGTLGRFLESAGVTRAEVMPDWTRELPARRYQWPDYGDSVSAPIHRKWNRYRRETVTEAVRGIRAVVDRHAASSGRALVLSAAVIPDPVRARRRFAQDWPAWIDEGLLDVAVLMCYAKGTKPAIAQLAAARAEAPARRIVAGAGAWHQPLGDAALSLRRMLDDDVRGVCVFPWSALSTDVRKSVRLVGRAWRPPSPAPPGSDR